MVNYAVKSHLQSCTDGLHNYVHVHVLGGVHVRYYQTSNFIDIKQDTCYYNSLATIKMLSKPSGIHAQKAQRQNDAAC